MCARHRQPLQLDVKTREHPTGMTRRLWLLPVVLAALAPPLAAQVELLLEPSLPSGQPAGTTIVWRATCNLSGELVYRFSAGPGGEDLLVLRDFSPDDWFEWTPVDSGEHQIQVAVRRLHGTTVEAETGETFTVVSPAADGQPVVTASAHPLVALFSVPPCAAAAEILVEARPADEDGWQRTRARSCQAGQGLSFWVGGLRAETAYVMRHVTMSPGGIVEGPQVDYTSGSIQGVELPTFVADWRDPERVSTTEPVVVVAPPPESSAGMPLATDLEGRVIWYHDRVHLAGEGCVLTTLEGGRALLLVGTGGVHGQRLREIDLAGNTLRETTVARINEQLAAAGASDQAGAFDHEAIRFANGHTLVQMSVERIIPGAQGAPPGVPVNVLGSMLVALDESWQVVWYWNAFDHLDVERPAVLGERCGDGSPGCPPLFLAPLANDWLHGNAIAATPDGHLIYSLRHQDWVIKIDYADGEGGGDVLWRLGPDGDLALTSPDPWPWFSHQHGASFVESDQLAVFDNGNTRCAELGDPCHSRGQVLRVNEASLDAELLVNVDLGVYSPALGMAQRLANGDHHFTAGMTSSASHQSLEVGHDGNIVHALEGAVTAYRSYRLRTMDGGVETIVFTDGFESGDTGAWAALTP